MATSIVRALHTNKDRWAVESHDEWAAYSSRYAARTAALPGLIEEVHVFLDFQVRMRSRYISRRRSA